MPPVRRSTRLSDDDGAKPYTSITTPIQLPTLPDLSQYTSTAPPPLVHSARPRSSHSSSTPISANPPARRDPSHSTKKPDGHIPRPPNAFILYRSWARTQKITDMPPGTKKSEQSVSKIVGTLWEDLPEHQKEIFREQARLLKAEHRRRWPNYKYSPRPRKSAASTTISATTPEPPTPAKRTAKRMDERSTQLCAEYAEQLRHNRKEEEELVAGVRDINEEMSKTLEKAVNANMYHQRRPTSAISYSYAGGRACSVPPETSSPIATVSQRPSTSAGPSGLSRIPSCMRPAPSLLSSISSAAPSTYPSPPSTSHSTAMLPPSNQSPISPNHLPNSQSFPFPPLSVYNFNDYSDLDIDLGDDWGTPPSTANTTVGGGDGGLSALGTPVDGMPNLIHSAFDLENPFMSKESCFYGTTDEGMWDMGMGSGMDMGVELNIDFERLMTHEGNNPLQVAV